MDYIEEKENSELLLDMPSSFVISKSNILKERIRMSDEENAKTLEKEFSEVTKKQKKSNSGVQNILNNSKALVLPILALSATVLGVRKVVNEFTKFRLQYSPLDKIEYESVIQPEPEKVDLSKAQYKGTDQKTIIKNKIIAEAKRQGIDPALALALADQESAFNPKAKSQTGARGIYQMTTPACKQVGIPFDDRLYDADYNIKYGLQYLKWCLDHTKTVEEALFAWNSGIGNLQTAKKRGDDLGTWNSANRVKKGGGFTTQTMPKIEKYKKELGNLYNQATSKSSITSTSAGKIKRVSNGTMVGQYKMNNTVAHGGKYYIDLSERAEAYLRDVGGRGLVTSGAEGEGHVKGTGMTHMAGNKVDIVAMKNTNEEWANTAIPFLKNKNTAFVVFEGFRKNEFLAIQKIIYSKIDSNLKALCDHKARQKGWGARGGKYLDYADDSKSIKNGRHLDIGILTNAYSFVNQYKESNPSEQQAKKGNEVKKPVQDNVNKQTALNKPKQTTTQPKTNAVTKAQPAISAPQVAINTQQKLNLVDVQSPNS